MKIQKVFPPAVFLKDELEARSELCKCCGQKVAYTQTKLAEQMNLPQRTISEIMTNKRRITTETAMKLAKVLGTSPEFWLRLQADWDIFQAKLKEKTINPHQS